MPPIIPIVSDKHTSNAAEGYPDAEIGTLLVAWPGVYRVFRRPVPESDADRHWEPQKPHWGQPDVVAWAPDDAELLDMAWPGGCPMPTPMVWFRGDGEPRVKLPPCPVADACESPAEARRRLARFPYWTSLEWVTGHPHHHWVSMAAHGAAEDQRGELAITCEVQTAGRKAGRHPAVATITPGRVEFDRLPCGLTRGPTIYTIEGWERAYHGRARDRTLWFTPTNRMIFADEDAWARACDLLMAQPKTAAAVRDLRENPPAHWG